LACHPFASRPPIILSRRPQLFRNCFRPFLLLLRLPQDFACLPLPRTLPGYFSFSLTLLRSSFRTSLSPLCCLASPGWYLFLDPSHLPSDFPLFSFILEMGEGIHETKLMITTSKERAKPTGGWSSSCIYLILFLSASFFTSHQSNSSVDFFSSSLVLLLFLFSRQFSEIFFSSEIRFVSIIPRIF
jgi:hypothetical protein